MKLGDIISVSTNANLLNKIIGTDYKQWMKCIYPLPNDIDIHMICLNSQDNGFGWVNKQESKNKIIEKYIGDPKDKLPSHNRMDFAKKRLIFDKRRFYVFKGLFEMSKDNCTPNYREWNLISDSYEF